MSDEPAATESQTDLRTTARSLRLRFSLRGIFVFVLGLAVALAYRRIPNVGWFDTILAACGCWIGVGIVQEIRKSWQLWRLSRHLASEVQWGFALELCRQLSAALMITAGAMFLLISQTREHDPNRDFMFDWTLANLAWVIFFFGIVVAYAPKTSPKRVDRSPAAVCWFVAYDWIAAVLGGYWLLYLLASQMTVTGLVHLAIRGVESYQPLRWTNEPFYPANLNAELSRQFVARSLLATLFITIALGSTLLTNRCWTAPVKRWGWLVTAVCSMGCASLLAWWAWTIAYPVLSPFLAPQTFTQPAINWVAGMTLVVGAALALACRVVSRPMETPDVVVLPLRQETLQHSLPLMILFMFATIGVCLREHPFMTEVRNLIGGSSSSFVEWLWGYSSGVLDAFVSDPKTVMQLAALIVVGWQVWKRWRGVAAEPEVLSAVNPAQLHVVGLLAAVTLLIAVPVAAWLGFVLVVYAPLLGL